MGSNQNANSSFACLHWQHCQDRMQRPNHISVSKIETMMMTVDITDCESCPDFFLLWRGEGREQKKDNSIRGYPFVKYGACAKYSLFPTKKSKSQPTLLLSTFFRCFDGFILLSCQTQEKIPMKLANQFSLMPICNFTVAVANHSCYSRRIVRIVWQRDELVMWFETAFAMICMDYHLFICRRESAFAFSFGSFSWVDQKR